MLTVSASEARSNFAKLGKQVATTGQPITVFKNSKPWLIISPAQSSVENTMIDLDENRGLSKEEQALMASTDKFIEEYHDVFQALAR